MDLLRLAEQAFCKAVALIWDELTVINSGYVPQYYLQYF